ncbi:MAG: nucleotidyltransferase family protein [Chloroflexi bacterium]|nr:nucleotidyltransferase family protein [Chloroflexota bacterium]
MVKKAIVLAAGRGRRLRPFTNNIPKPMLPWNGRPTLETILVALKQMGISELCLITHYLAEQIEAFVGNGSAWGLQTCFLQQEKMDGSATAVQQAATFIDSPTLILAADYILSPNYLQDLHNAYLSNDTPLIISLKRLPPEQIQQRSSVRFRSDGTVAEIVEKPAVGQAPSQIGASLIYIVPPQIQGYLTQLHRSPRGEYELPSVINQMLRDGYRATGLLQPAPQEWQPS